MAKNTVTERECVPLTARLPPITRAPSASFESVDNPREFLSPSDSSSLPASQRSPSPRTARTSSRRSPAGTSSPRPSAPRLPWAARSPPCRSETLTSTQL